MKQIQDIGKAIALYYGKIELRNADITELFGVTSPATVQRIKEPARRLALKRNVMLCNSAAVNTYIAFEAWGLDIADLEHRYKKLQQYGLKETAQGHN